MKAAIKILKSVTGYSCPNCGAICSDHSFVSATKKEMNHNYNYSWTETHKCTKCETIYTLENGT
jgi:predicted RNA-binding Zn-ribbon protein involved in translation (DUF1610 family)